MSESLSVSPCHDVLCLGGPAAVLNVLSEIPDRVGNGRPQVTNLRRDIVWDAINAPAMLRTGAGNA